MKIKSKENNFFTGQFISFAKQTDGRLSNGTLVRQLSVGVLTFDDLFATTCQWNVVLKCEINVLNCKCEALNRRDDIYLSNSVMPPCFKQGVTLCQSTCTFVIDTNRFTRTVFWFFFIQNNKISNRTLWSKYH